MAHQAAERESDAAEQRSSSARLLDATRDTPDLVVALRQAGWPGAVRRYKTHRETRAFGRVRVVQVELEPAIPLGLLWWESVSYNRDYPDGLRTGHHCLSGMTRNGDVVVMEPDKTGEPETLTSPITDIYEALHRHAEHYGV